MSNDHIHRLDELGFVWSPFDAQWEEGFSAMKKFYEKVGHCLTSGEQIIDGYRLGQWANVQRALKDKNLSSDRVSRLDELGFIWNVNEALWVDGFEALQKFNTREGHCLVPARHKEADFPLGGWVSRQRKAKNKLSEYQLRQLNDLGFIWDTTKDQIL